MSGARKYALRGFLALVVTVAASGYVRHRVRASQQERYRLFFESKGLCFQSWETGTRGHVRWVSVRPCSENDHYPAKDITTEVELNTSLDCSPVEFQFIDIDGDGIPEVHVSGLDNDTTHAPEDHGNNFFRYDPKTNTLIPIPLEAVPRKWRDRYPEDSKCVGVFP
jgi:hypothetical protein